MVRGCAGVELIKIDVEGFELEVLKGARKTLRVHRPVVHFEFLARLAVERGFTIDTYREFFDNLDYRLRWANHSRGDAALVSPDPSNYVVAIPVERMSGIGEELR